MMHSNGSYEILLVNEHSEVNLVCRVISSLWLSVVVNDLF